MSCRHRSAFAVAVLCLGLLAPNPFVARGQQAAAPKAPVFFVGFLANGKQLLTASQDGHHVWDLTTGNILRSFGGADKSAVVPNRISVGALSANGKTFAVYESDQSIRLWHTATGNETRRIATREADAVGSLLAVSMAFSPEGTMLALRGQDQVVRLFSADKGELFRRLGKPTNIKPFRSGVLAYGVPCDDSVVFSPDGKLLAAVFVETEEGKQKGWVRWYDVSSGELVREVLIRQPNPFADVRTGFGIACLALTAEGKTRLAWASSDGTARLYDADSGQEIRRLPAIQNGVHAVLVFSADRRLLAYRASNDPAVHLIDLVGGKRTTAARQAQPDQLNPHPSSHTFAFSPDGRILAERLFGSAHTFWDVLRTP